MKKLSLPKITNRKRDNTEQKLKAIREVTLYLLDQHGYDQVTMQMIAQYAKMSKNTLYGLFASKEALFADLVKNNASNMHRELEALVLSPEMDIKVRLQRFGEEFLTLIAGSAAITVNRVAIASVTSNNKLAQLLDQYGRQANLPLLDNIIKQAIEAKLLLLDTPENANDIFISLLLGDVQIRRLLGAVPALSKKAIQQKTEEAVGYFIRLFGT